MDLSLFAKSINFHCFQPSSSLKWYNRLNHRLARLGITLEIANTILPIENTNCYQKLKKLVRTVPKMSTYANAAIINKAVASMPPDTAFVNVGVWHGFSFLAGIANNPDRQCIAVDNFSQFGGPKDEFIDRYHMIKSNSHFFHEMDYEQYFSSIHREQIGFYIYDGEHSYSNQLRGLEAAEPFFAKGCVILVDDTNDAEPRQATLDFIARYPGRYRMIFDQSTAMNGHPTFWNGILMFVLQEQLNH